MNAPAAFRAAWAFARPLIHPHTQKKIAILGGGTALADELETRVARLPN